MKRIFCLLLSLLMLAACLSSCGEGKVGEDTAPDTVEGVDTTEEADTSEETSTENDLEARVQEAIAALFDGAIVDGVAERELELPTAVNVDGEEYSINWVKTNRSYFAEKSNKYLGLEYEAEITASDGTKLKGVGGELEYNIPVDVSRFEGKKVATFGASVTWYDGNPYNWGKQKDQIAVGYQKYMRDILGFEIDNFGVSGWTMPQIMKGMASKDLTGYDYITIKGGTNDERHGVPMGKLQPKGGNHDINTFIGSVQAGIEYALYVNPDVEILVCTPTPGWIYAPDGYGEGNPQTDDGDVPEKWADALKEIAALYGLEVCDFYNKTGFTVANRPIYMNDPEPPENKLYSTHPTTAGYKVMGNIIVDTFIEKY